MESFAHKTMWQTTDNYGRGILLMKVENPKENDSTLTTSFIADFSQTDVPNEVTIRLNQFYYKSGQKLLEHKILLEDLVHVSDEFQAFLKNRRNHEKFKKTLVLTMEENGKILSFSFIFAKTASIRISIVTLQEAIFVEMAFQEFFDVVETLREFCEEAENGQDIC